MMIKKNYLKSLKIFQILADNENSICYIQKIKLKMNSLEVNI